MSYMKWFETHANKHHDIVQKLSIQNYTKEMIIDYFFFENMVEKEPTFCLLYANKQKCHVIKSLNCYLCACPYFRFNDEGLKEKEGLLHKSACSINSKKSSYFRNQNIMHLDCSECLVPHTKTYISKHFDMNWKKIMHACLVRP